MVPIRMHVKGRGRLFPHCQKGGNLRRLLEFQAASNEESSARLSSQTQTDADEVHSAAAARKFAPA